MDNYTELREEIAALKARERGMVEVLGAVINMEMDNPSYKDSRFVPDHIVKAALVLSSNPNTKLYKAQDDVVEAAINFDAHTPDIAYCNGAIARLKGSVATLERIEQEMK